MARPSPRVSPGGDVWSIAPEEVYAALASDPAGLSEAEAAARRQRVGPNRIPEPPRTAHWRRFLAELTHFMALLLWVGGGLAFLAGTPELGWAIWAVVIVNAMFSFFQGYKAERALAALREMLPPTARVLRDGRPLAVDARQLVPGDVIDVEAGDRVCADARLVSAAGLQVDLSMLSGESVPAPRDAQPSPGETAAVDRRDAVLAGTLAVAGHGRAVVVATGGATELGGIARLGASVRRPPTRLEEDVRHVVRVVTVVAFVIGAGVGLSALLIFGLSPASALVLGVGMIVANVPEGLLPTVTLALAMSVRRMASRRALVRSLSAVEALSATDLILSDKTGTLTQNEMTVVAVWAAGETLTVTGTGYRGAGALVADDPGGLAAARRALALGALCCNATLAPEPTGDPTEIAILVAARKAGIDVAGLAERSPRLAEVPFDSARRHMSVTVRATDGRRLAVTKGAPSTVLAGCELDPDTHERVQEALDGFAAEGLRVLAIAARDDAGDAGPLELAGLVAMADPPREGVEEALRVCREAGVGVAMMTGDESATALAIARRLGLVSGRHARVTTGAEIDALDDEQLRRVVGGGRRRVFARVTPAHKLRLVEAFQAVGHTVAVTGDGVNDAPALRAARVGIAMGRGGTDVAREAADIVLLDDNFATIVHAIEEGRTVHRNLRKFIAYILASNVPELVPFVAMIALGIPPALTILQILAIDLGTDLLPALALGAERPEAGTMRAPPRARDDRLLDARLLWRAYGYVGVIEAAITMAAFAYFWVRAGVDLEGLRALAPALAGGHATPAQVELYQQSTTVALAAVVAAQVGNAIACRSEQANVTIGPLPPNPLLRGALIVELVLLAAYVYLPPLQRLLDTRPFPLASWMPLLAAPAAVLLLEELRKLIAPRLGRSAPVRAVDARRRRLRQRPST